MDIRVIMILIAEAAFAFLLLMHVGVLKTLRGRIAAVLFLFLAFFIRASLLDYETTDYQWFLTRWVEYYRSNSGFAALKDSLGNYNIPYLYFLALFSYSSVKDLYLIKLLSIFFDVVLAYGCLQLILKCGGTAKRAAAGFFIVLFLPTVILNGAKWGQCDSIYVAFAILGIELALGERSAEKASRPCQILSVVCIAISFGFKLQAVFFMPLWPVIWLRKKYPLRDILIFPLTYFLLILPAVLLGRPIKDAILLYVDQADTVGTAMNYNSPSMTALIRNVIDPEVLSRLCIILAFLAVAGLMTAGIIFKKHMTNDRLLGLTLLTVLVIPFLLPHMHDRYFYPADCLTVAFACAMTVPDIKKLPEQILRGAGACLMQFGSLICYLAYFSGYYQPLGHIYLTNDRGAVAVILCILITALSMVPSRNST